VLAFGALAALLLAAPGDRGAAPRGLLAALSAAPAGGARAAAATRWLVGAKYRRDPLGEGAGPDPEPRFRLDAFDCQTFVETAIALGSSRTLAEAARALDDIRYEGTPSLPARHHEMQAQWIPANLARGWIAEATREIADERVVLLARTFTAASWTEVHRAGRAVWGLPRDREPLGRFETWAVLPEDLEAVAPRIPEGAVVLVLREDRVDRPTRVSHVGLVVIGPEGERLVRHATSTRGVERVIEEPLSRFIAREARAYPSWPVAGFAIYAIPDSSLRVEALSR